MSKLWPQMAEVKEFREYFPKNFMSNSKGDLNFWWGILCRFDQEFVKTYQELIRQSTPQPD